MRRAQTIPERAFKAARAYLARLEAGKNPGGPAPDDRPEPSRATIEAEREADRWHEAKVKRWIRAGRVREDGVLRLSTTPPRRWTAGRVKAAFRHLARPQAAKVAEALGGRKAPLRATSAPQRPIKPISGGSNERQDQN